MESGANMFLQHLIAVHKLKLGWLGHVQRLTRGQALSL